MAKNLMQIYPQLLKPVPWEQPDDKYTSAWLLLHWAKDLPPNNYDVDLTPVMCMSTTEALKIIKRINNEWYGNKDVVAWCKWMRKLIGEIDAKYAGVLPQT